MSAVGIQGQGVRHSVYQRRATPSKAHKLPGGCSIVNIMAINLSKCCPVSRSIVGKHAARPMYCSDCHVCCQEKAFIHSYAWANLLSVPAYITHSQSGNRFANLMNLRLLFPRPYFVVWLVVIRIKLGKTLLQIQDQSRVFWPTSVHVKSHGNCEEHV